MGGAASRYRVVRPIKRGGIAEVLEAVVQGGHDFERRVVLKQLLPGFLDDEKVVHAFIDEARIVGQLSHPNIVGILDFGMLDERPFQVLEHVDGLDLEEIGKLADGKGARFPPAVALHVAVEIARALEYAHGATDRNGRAMAIVHRDVSPANVMISWNGDVKLADFGVARAKRRIGETQVGLTKGTFAYMAPEQARAEAVDGRADLYSLGCVLHWMLTGHSPIEKDTVRLKVAAGSDVQVSSEIPEDVAQLIRRATRFHPNDRFPSAGDLADATWAVLMSHAKQDIRRATRAWLRTLRPSETKQQGAPQHAMAELFNVELLGNIDAPVRRFTAVGGPPRPAIEGEAELDESSLGAETVISTAEERAASSTPDPDEVIRLPVEMVEPTKAHMTNESDRTLEIERLAPDGTADQDPLLGSSVHGYRLVRLIGRGGWSSVYLARHESLELEYAVKVLSPQTTTEIGTKRLHREARTMSQLRHTNIAQVVDFGVLAGGRPFLTMEMIRGRTLYSMIMASAPFPAERTAFYTRQIALGLGAAHRLGIVHRDLKPANVMVVDIHGQEVLKILDFGIARSIDAALGETRLTAQDRLLGTPTYMAPEQIVSPSNVTPASDLYSLGIVMYRMLRRSSPFEGTRSEVVESQLRAVPPSLEDHGALGRLVLDLLAKNPSDRPANAAEVIARLDDIGLDEPALPDPDPANLSSMGSAVPEITDALPSPTSVLAPERSGARRVFAGALLFALCVGVAALLGYGWWMRRTEAKVVTFSAEEPKPEIRPVAAPAVPRDRDSEALEPAAVTPRDAPPSVRIEPREKRSEKRGQNNSGRLETLERRYRSALKKQGLSGRDVATDPTASTLVAEWEEALRAKDASRAEKALAGLKRQLPAIGSRPATIERKMARVSKSLEALLEKNASREVVEALESRYLDLRVEFEPTADAKTLSSLASRLHALEQDIARARQAGAR